MIACHVAAIYGVWNRLQLESGLRRLPVVLIPKIHVGKYGEGGWQYVV
jgi:hypothetical protein